MSIIDTIIGYVVLPIWMRIEPIYYGFRGYIKTHKKAYQVGRYMDLQSRILEAIKEVDRDCQETGIFQVDKYSDGMVYALGRSFHMPAGGTWIVKPEMYRILLSMRDEDYLIHSFAKDEGYYVLYRSPFSGIFETYRAVPAFFSDAVIFRHDIYLKQILEMIYRTMGKLNEYKKEKLEKIARWDMDVKVNAEPIAIMPGAMVVGVTHRKETRVEVFLVRDLILNGIESEKQRFERILDHAIDTFSRALHGKDLDESFGFWIGLAGEMSENGERKTYAVVDGIQGYMPTLYLYHWADYRPFKPDYRREFVKVLTNAKSLWKEMEATVRGMSLKVRTKGEPVSYIETSKLLYLQPYDDFVNDEYMVGTQVDLGDKKYVIVENSASEDFSDRMAAFASYAIDGAISSLVHLRRYFKYLKKLEEDLLYKIKNPKDGIGFNYTLDLMHLLAEGHNIQYKHKQEDDVFFCIYEGYDDGMMAFWKLTEKFNWDRGKFSARDIQELDEILKERARKYPEKSSIGRSREKIENMLAERMPSVS